MPKKKKTARKALIKASAKRLAKHRKVKVLTGKAFTAKMNRAKAQRAAGILHPGQSGYSLVRGRIPSKRPVGACRPTVAQSSKQRNNYGQLCKIYTKLGEEYRNLGNSAFGSPKGSAVRKQYHKVQKQYKEVGVSLFRMGRPRADYGKQHTMSPSEWSRDYDRKRAALTASYGKKPKETYRR